VHQGECPEENHWFGWDHYRSDQGTKRHEGKVWVSGVLEVQGEYGFGNVLRTGIAFDVLG
jgi:hypothetical protein